MTDYKDLLPDFLDGNLSEDEEKAIFYQLSQDDELLAEYKQLKAIFVAIDNSKNSFAPSQEQTDKVFAALGIGSEENKKRAFPFFLHKPIVKYLATAAASVLLFLSISKFDNSEIFNFDISNKLAKQYTKHKLSDNTSTSYNNTLSPQDNSISDNTPNNANSSSESKARYKRKRAKSYDDEGIPQGAMFTSTGLAHSYSFADDSPAINEAISTDEVYIDNTERAANEAYYSENATPIHYDYDSTEEEQVSCPPDANIAMEAPAEEHSSYDYSQDVFRSAPLYLSQDFTSNNSRNPYYNYKMRSFSVPKDKFYLEIKNHIYFSKVKEEVNTNYTNLGISLYYNLVDNLSLGVDVRDESFNKYSNRNLVPNIKSYGSESKPQGMVSGSTFFSIENVATTTVSMNAKYDLLTKFREFTPSASVSLGVNSAGTVGRASLNCSFNTMLNFTASVGAEYSVLSYHYMGLNTTSSKLGVSFGISYNF